MGNSHLHKILHLQAPAIRIDSTIRGEKSLRMKLTPRKLEHGGRGRDAERGKRSQ